MNKLLSILFLCISLQAYSQFDELVDIHTTFDYINVETNDFTAQNSYGFSGRIIFNFHRRYAFRTGAEIIRYRLKGRTQFEFLSDSTSSSENFSLKGYELQIPVQIMYRFSRKLNPNWYFFAGMPIMRKALSSTLHLTTTDPEIKESVKTGLTVSYPKTFFGYELGFGFDVNIRGGRGLVFEMRYKNFKNSHFEILGNSNITTTETIPFVGLLAISGGLVF